MMIYAASEKPQDDLPYEEMSEVNSQAAPPTTLSLWGLSNVLKILLFFVSQGEKIIYEYFSDPEFIVQLIEFLSLEERKGKDSFNPRRFCLFKVQFKFSCCDAMTSYFFDKEVTQRSASRQGWTQESCNFFHHLLWFIVLCQRVVHLHQPNGCNLSFSEEKKYISFFLRRWMNPYVHAHLICRDFFVTMATYSCH